MDKRFLWTLIILLALIMAFCWKSKPQDEEKEEITPGALQTGEYIDLIKNKKIAVVANHSSLIDSVHLVDSLLSLNINIKKIFSPEHGFRGDVDAGEYFDDYTDSLTGLPVISLYGKKFKPTKRQLKGIDLMLFDIQDVGVRFYTYISTLHYMMEACAERDIEFILLDRPNPNGFYIDGPVLDIKHASFVGLHPVPLVYGMTIGELALMINGESWLEDSITCDIKIVPCKGYNHNSRYNLPVNPSPNLQSMEAVYLYPSFGLFEGTIMSVGRGTESPFQIIGHPDYPDTSFTFTPRGIPGVCAEPLYKDEKCYGISFRKFQKSQLSKLGSVNISTLIKCYNALNNNHKFFNSYFNMLAGGPELRNQIENGATAIEIKRNWQKQAEAFKEIRNKYLLYEDFVE